MRTPSILAAACLALVIAWPADGLAQKQQKLYKHVDKNGRVYYTDRPTEGGQKTHNLPPPNVESPEASRQLRNDLYNRQREEAAERNAAQRRHYSVIKREREQKLRERQQYYEANPGERPRPIQIVR